jgi:hypothetical protein
MGREGKRERRTGRISGSGRLPKVFERLLVDSRKEKKEKKKKKRVRRTWCCAHDVVPAGQWKHRKFGYMLVRISTC